MVLDILEDSDDVSIILPDSFSVFSGEFLPSRSLLSKYTLKEMFADYDEHLFLS